MSITIGGWFQRTTLHLTELQNFFSGNSVFGLNSDILNKNLIDLKVKNFERVVDEIEFLKIKLSNDLTLKIFEDGLITLKKEVNINDVKLLKLEMEVIKNFYENNLSKAISYVFSRGAPVPKELAKIEAVYPFILESESDNVEDILKIFEFMNDKITSKFEEENYRNIYKGKELFVLNNFKHEAIFFDLLAETEIFFREFKVQMSRYLHIHREIWEKINLIKSRDYIRGNEILKIREELQEEQKTVNLIEARINQMPVYLKTRQKLTELTGENKIMHPLFQYKFETLLNTHDYIKSLWFMTKNYMNSANEMLSVLQAESTKSSISSLTLITTMGVVAGLVNYMAREAYPKVTFIGMYYFVLLLVITFLVNMSVLYFFKFKKYKIKK
jgi:hypothetical protein